MFLTTITVLKLALNAYRYIDAGLQFMTPIYALNQ